MTGARIAIFIPAYQASRTIEATLDRIPAETWDQVEEVFVNDNHSDDGTYQRVDSYREGYGLEKLKIFRFPRNLGYGGSLKRAFSYAIERGFDVMVEVHADGQYPPEMALDLARVLLEGGYDMVQGSRVERRAGGMPLYKVAGNTLLNWVEEAAFRYDLLEYHSGFRAYRCEVLKRLPYWRCGNGHGITAEMVAMFRMHGLRIGEVEVPTYYASDVSACSLATSVRYGLFVLRLVVEYYLARSRLYVHPRFRHVDEDALIEEAKGKGL